MKCSTVSVAWNPAAEPGPQRRAALPEEPMEEEVVETPAAMTVSCYENQIPPFIEFALDRLYGSLYSSMKQFRIYDSLGGGIHTYVVRSGMQIRTVFLFRCEKQKVFVLNEVIGIDREQMEMFAQYVFSRIAGAQVILFRAIHTEAQMMAFPFQRFNIAEDIVVTLPATPEEYHSSLGKNTRRNIKRYGERLRNAFPSYTYEVFETADIDPQDVLDIIELNRARMAGKNKTSAIDGAEAQRQVRLAKKCGLIGVCRIDGKVVAGGISFHIGDHFFLNVIAHDPAYDEYWLGILCCYQTIRECILRGAKEFHFLWGRYDYKFTLQGVQRDLDNVAVYKSRMHMLLNARTLAGNIIKDRRRRLSQWLHDAAHRGDSLPGRVYAKLNRLRGQIQPARREAPAGGQDAARRATAGSQGGMRTESASVPDRVASLAAVREE